MAGFTDFISFVTPKRKHLEYLLSLPEENTRGRDYHVLLAVPPGDLNREFLGGMNRGCPISGNRDG